MMEILTRIRVGPDRRISGTAPATLPEGEHEARITIAEPQPPKPGGLDELPTHDLPWDGSISLRREDIYGDDGR